MDYIECDLRLAMDTFEKYQQRGLICRINHIIVSTLGWEASLLMIVIRLLKRRLTERKIL